MHETSLQCKKPYQTVTTPCAISSAPQSSSAWHIAQVDNLGHQALHILSYTHSQQVKRHSSLPSAIAERRVDSNHAEVSKPGMASKMQCHEKAEHCFTQQHILGLILSFEPFSPLYVSGTWPQFACQNPSCCFCRPCVCRSWAALAQRLILCVRIQPSAAGALSASLRLLPADLHQALLDNGHGATTVDFTSRILGDNRRKQEMWQEVHASDGGQASAGTRRWVGLLGIAPPACDGLPPHATSAAGQENAALHKNRRSIVVFLTETRFVRASVGGLCSN